MKAIVAAAAILVPMAIGALQTSLPAEQVARPSRVEVRSPAHAGRSVWDSVYTDEQGKRGQAVYAEKCARCHMDTLTGDDDAPPLSGGEFLAHWDGLTVGALHDLIRVTMPDDDPGTVSRREITDVLAYILTFNGFPAGRIELPMDSDSLKAIQFDAKRK
jgi:S-disulfanyl-L-cysteine oxidoreductase SoxD